VGRFADQNLHFSGHDRGEAVAGSCKSLKERKGGPYGGPPDKKTVCDRVACSQESWIDEQNGNLGTPFPGLNECRPETRQITRVSFVAKDFTDSVAAFTSMSTVGKFGSVHRHQFPGGKGQSSQE
jgi:hypothetical protein